MRRIPSNCDDIIDSRDIIKRREELEEEIADFKTDATTEYEAIRAEHDENKDNSHGEGCDCEGVRYTLEDFIVMKMIDKADEETELKALVDLCDEGEGYPDWAYGATLIADHYFEEYARQLADDLGLVQRDVSWPYTHIDWEAAAKELKQDYGTVDFDGNEYYVRS